MLKTAYVGKCHLSLTCPALSKKTRSNDIAIKFLDPARFVLYVMLRLLAIKPMKISEVITGLADINDARKYA